MRNWVKKEWVFQDINKGVHEKSGIQREQNKKSYMKNECFRQQNKWVHGKEDIHDNKQKENKKYLISLIQQRKNITV